MAEHVESALAAKRRAGPKRCLTEAVPAAQTNRERFPLQTLKEIYKKRRQSARRMRGLPFACGERCVLKLRVRKTKRTAAAPGKNKEYLR